MAPNRQDEPPPSGLPPRIRVAGNGSIKLPEDLREALGWKTGDYLEFEARGDRLEIWRVEVDHFAEAMKKPDSDTFDKIIRKQAERKLAAFDEFDEKMKNPPELRPEDRPEFWD